MRTKRFDTLLQVRISGADKIQLADTAWKLGINQATLARLSLREGMIRIRGKLPIAPERAAEGS